MSSPTHAIRRLGLRPAALVALVTLAVAACGGGASPSPSPALGSPPPAGGAAPPLEGTRWVLPDGDVPGLPAGVVVDAVFDGGRLSGQGPCNAYDADYTLDGERLALGPIASTKKSCGDLDRAEEAFLGALSRTATFTIAGDTLTLRDESGTQLASFRADVDGGKGDPGTALPGTAWTVTGYAGATGVATGVIPGTPISLEFGVNGSAGGSAGCNSYGGDFRADPGAGSLAFGRLMQTLMACDPPATMTQESAYLAALAQTAAYRIAGGMLTLLDAKGNPLVEAEPAA